MDEKKIKRQAKQILDKFANALAKVDSEKIGIGVDRKEFERKEGDGKKSAEGFKKRFLKNAPQHNDDFIIAEKGGWK